MNEQLRMFLLASNTMLEYPNSEGDAELIAYLVSSNILLLYALGDEESIDIAHILLETAMISPRFSDNELSLIRSVVQLDGDE